MRFAGLAAGCLAVLPGWSAPLPSAPARAPRPGGLYDIREFGAVGDGSTRSTEAIRKAIAAAAHAGGGTVYVPPGTYLTGAIQLASNLVLHVAAGATLKFHTDLAEYPIEKGRWEGISCLTPAPLIGGTGLENVTLTGRGTLTTDNAAWVERMSVPEAAEAWERVKQRLESGLTVADEDLRSAARFLRPSFIRTIESRNVRIEGLRIVGSPMWAVHVLYSEDVVVDGLTVDTFPGRNGDGIDVESSRNVRISNCLLETGDDAIVLKSGRDADGRRVNRPTENVAISNCTIRRGHGAVVIGSETAGGIRNVVASNIISVGTDRGIRIKSTRGRGGVVENVRFENWVIEDPTRAGIDVTAYYTRTAPEAVSPRTPVFRDIAIVHTTIKRAPLAIRVEGLPEQPVEGLRLSDVTATSRLGALVRDTLGLELHDVRVDAERGPAFLFRDSPGLVLRGVSGASSPVIRLEASKDAVVQGCVAGPGTGIFLSIEPGQRALVSLEGNHVAGAAQPVVEVAGSDPRIFDEVAR